MPIAQWHPSTLAGVWAIDLLVLLLLWPAGAPPGDLGAVLLMWGVPTVPVALLTWRWWRARTGPRA